jgi:DNA (cytosine-5)-methyltransferase 1
MARIHINKQAGEPADREGGNAHASQHSEPNELPPPPEGRGFEGAPMRRSNKRPRRQPGTIIDLFAGAGGWAEGLRMLGMSALGIESDQWACATSRVAGHECLQADVAALDPASLGRVWGIIGSPPCQAYSSAGKGLGRQDKPLVIACAHELAAGNDTRHERLARCQDSRSLLTVEPLRYVLALRPRWVALEQVPAVLELWSVFAGLLAAHSYQTAVGVLSAERYGVPQTRKRAFLIASLDGPVQLPPATHRSYNPRRSEIPEDELGLLPWVSMARALGWQTGDRVGFPRRNDTPSNHPAKSDTGTHRARDRRPACRPASTLTARTRPWTRKPCVQIRRSGDRIEEGFDPTGAPAQAVTTRVNRWQAHGIATSEGANWTGERPAPTLVTTRRSKDGALVGRQLPPGEGVERGGWAWRNGTQANAAVRRGGEPAPTVHFGHALNQVQWIPCCEEGCPARLTPSWARERPATTVACDRRVHPPGHKQNSGDPPGRYEQRRGANAVRVTVEQASILQGFPAGYPWQGARTRQFTQLGNAVPPPLAHRVLEQATGPSLPSSSAVRRARRSKTQRQQGVTSK